MRLPCPRNPRQLRNPTRGNKQPRLRVTLHPPLSSEIISEAGMVGFVFYANRVSPVIAPIAFHLLSFARRYAPVAPRPGRCACTDSSDRAHPPCCARNSSPAMLRARVCYWRVAFDLLHLSLCASSVAPVMFFASCCDRGVAPVILHLLGLLPDRGRGRAAAPQ